MHVMHVIPGLDIGGAETMLLQLVRALGAPYEHTVVNMQKGGRLAVALEEAGARVVHLGMPRGRPNIRGLARLVRYATQKPVDVAQGWMYHGNLGAHVVARITQPHPALVWSVHTHAVPSMRTPATWAVAQTNALFSHAPDAVVYVARAAMETHLGRGFASDNAVYIPGGIDTQTFKPDMSARATLRTQLKVPQDASVVALLARLHPMKDHANFLEAAKLCDVQNTHFIFAGDGLDELPASLAAHVTPALRPRLHWLGARSDVAMILQGADICALSSAHSEALPRILLEAMACGTACVATDVGDCAALLQDVGWITPPRAPHALARAWGHVLTRPQTERTARQQRGRKRIEQTYSLNQMAREFTELYNQVARHQSLE